MIPPFLWLSDGFLAANSLACTAAQPLQADQRPVCIAEMAHCMSIQELQAYLTILGNVGSCSSIDSMNAQYVIGADHMHSRLDCEY